jgi:hypothetical protein
VWSDEDSAGALQLSLALGESNTGWLGQLMVLGASVVNQVGAAVSATTTVCPVVAVWPHTSLTVQVRWYV